MIVFIIWSLFGVFIIGLGIKDMFSKNPVVKKSKEKEVRRFRLHTIG